MVDAVETEVRSEPWTTGFSGVAVETEVRSEPWTTGFSGVAVGTEIRSDAWTSGSLGSTIRTEEGSCSGARITDSLLNDRLRGRRVSALLLGPLLLRVFNAASWRRPSREPELEVVDWVSAALALALVVPTGGDGKRSSREVVLRVRDSLRRARPGRSWADEEWRPWATSSGGESSYGTSELSLKWW